MLGNFSFGDYFKDEAVDERVGVRHRAMGLPAEQSLGDRSRGRSEARARRGYGRDRGVEARRDAGRPDRAARQGQLLAGSRDRAVRALLGDLPRPRLRARLRRARRAVPGANATASWSSTTSFSWSTTCGRSRKLVPLPNQNVDTGLGVERGACLLQGVDSVFDSDGFQLIMSWVEQRVRSRLRRERRGDEGSPRPRRSRARDVVPDRRRGHSVERGPRLHLPANHPARRPARSAHRARPRLSPRRGRRASRWVTPTRSSGSTRQRSSASYGRRRSVSARRSRAGRRSSTSSPARTRSSGEEAFDLVDDVRLPDRAHPGARRGARAGSRHRPLPDAHGRPPGDLAGRRREHDRAARGRDRRRRLPADRVRRLREDRRPHCRRGRRSGGGHPAARQAGTVAVLCLERRSGERLGPPRARG